MNFSSLALDKALIDALEKLGYESATPIQQQAIPLILSGKDIMAGAQTGTGKTAAFALPILQRLIQCVNETQLNQPRTVKALVLTPTRELAQQVYNNFTRYAQNTTLKITVAYGGVSINQQRSDMKEGLDILIATPGRLLDHVAKENVNLSQLQTLVFDEADRMLDMGFKDEIERILKRVPNKRQTLLFSATFDDEIFRLKNNLLKEPILIEVSERNTAAVQVEQKIYRVDNHRKRELTSFIIGSKNWHQVLVFTRTKKMADELAKEMCKDGIKTQSIHGDKSQGARERVLTEFKQGNIRALVATDVAARGIDIIDLKYVINYELPYVAEDYIHRIGRTGRAGNEGLAISLMSQNEEGLLKAIEKVLDQVLLQQWFPGFTPDLTIQNQSFTKNNKKALRNKALGITSTKKNRHSKRR